MRNIAQQLLEFHPQAAARIVFPAILLHGIGWSQLPPDQILSTIAPDTGRLNLAPRREREGSSRAPAILQRHAVNAAEIARITQIIGSHDSRSESMSIAYSLVKDADKL